MKLVVLDCDGTLVDSQNGICAAMTHAFTGFGLVAPTREATLAIVGLSLPEAFAVLAAEHDEGLRAQMVQRYKSAFLEIRRDPELHEPLFGGIAAAVEAFGKRDDVVLGIATGKSRRGVDRLFEREGWANRFLTVQTSDDHPSKPHPAMLHAAMAETGATPDRTVMVGDTTFDMEMARAAGVGALGVAWGYHSIDELRAAGAQAVVESCDSLTSDIDAFFATRGEGRVTEPADKPASKVPGREALHAPLPKRFYQKVDVREEPGGGFAVLLDGRAVRTPKKLPLQVPTRALAEAIAAEWSAQTERIDPGTMPLSKIAITTIDGVEQNAAEVAGEIVRFAGSDLLCYRAEGLTALADLQSMTWDPTLRWIEAETGERFLLAEGVMPVTQSRQALSAFAELLEPFGAFALACLHVMTTLTGSAFLALAVANGRMTPAEAWAAAHLDEDWQIARWGIDVEAADRRERRWQEMQSAGRFLELLAK